MSYISPQPEQSSQEEIDALETIASLTGTGYLTKTATTWELIDADFSGFVPYTGATSALDLGANTLTTTGLGTFGNLDVDTLNFNGNVISDSTGAISFDNENLTTTGKLGFGTTIDANSLINSSFTQSASSTNGYLRKNVFTHSGDTIMGGAFAYGDYLDMNISGTDKGGKNSYGRYLDLDDTSAVGGGSTPHNTYGDYMDLTWGGTSNIWLTGHYTKLSGDGTSGAVSDRTGHYINVSGDRGTNYGLNIFADIDALDDYSSVYGARIITTVDNSDGGTGTGYGLWLSATAQNSATAYSLWINAGNAVIGADNTKLAFGAAGATDSYLQWDASGLDMYSSGGIYDFNSAANTDLTLNFRGTTNSGILKWMEDEDYFLFSDDINLGSEGITTTGTGTFGNLEIGTGTTKGAISWDEANTKWLFGTDAKITSNSGNLYFYGTGTGTNNGQIKFLGSSLVVPESLAKMNYEYVRMLFHKASLGATSFEEAGGYGFKWRNNSGSGFANTDLMTLSGTGDLTLNAGGNIATTGTGTFGNMTIGSGAAGVDYTLTFNGETNDGVITWMEDEDYFDFSKSINIGENSYQLKDTLSGDGKWSGITTSGTLGATIAMGDLIYLNNDDGRWELVDANESDGYDKQLGICLVGGNDGSTTVILLYGKVRSAVFPAFTVGSPLYMSETAGDVTHTAPTTTDSAVRVLGFALTAEDFMFNPSNDYLINN